MESFSEILRQLGGKLNTHFTNEEEIFKSFGMPEDFVLSHVHAHGEILAQYAQLQLELMHGKAFNRPQVLLMVKGWIIDNVVRHDLKMRGYIRMA